MPIPQLNLSLGLTDNDGSVFYAGSGEGKVIVRTDTALIKHTISIIISEQEVGKINLRTHLPGSSIPSEIEIPTYQMILTDDKTNEKEIYKVTRDTFVFKEQTTKKSIWSFLGLKFLAPKNFLFENIPFEPLKEEIETFDISKYRKLNSEELTYTFEKDNQTIQLFAGDINTLEIQKGISYFIIVDENNGKKLIGDLLYREKFLKLTPKVKLHIVKRNKVTKAMETDLKGKADKLIYL